MPSGTIKEVVADRGSGFITAADGREHVCHRSGVSAWLDFDWFAGGEAVPFDIDASPKGPRAMKVWSAP